MTYSHVLYNVVVGMMHRPNGFDDLLNNELTSPELTITDNGRMLDIKFWNGASDARLDVYMSNSLGHHVPGRIFTSVLPVTTGYDRQKVTECKFSHMFIDCDLQFKSGHYN